MMATALARYDLMCTAIAECVRVDEAKDIRDKSLALEAYYRQARNVEAEREAANVRLRAERRSGELLKDLARIEPAEKGRRAHGEAMSMSGGGTNSPYAAALETNGMSRQTAHRFQALADVPEETFEAALRAPDRPSAAAITRHNEARAKVRDPAPTPTVSNEALALWGEFRDFEIRNLFHIDHAAALRSMTDGMRADIRRLIPHLRVLLDELDEHLVNA